MTHIPARCALLLILFMPASGALAVDTGYAGRAEVAEFVAAMVREHDFDPQQLDALFAEARRRQPILDAIARPAERTLTWAEYRRIFVQPDRIAQGLEFRDRHDETLERAAGRYGVAPEVIVAILGVETRYGRHAGRWRVLDALTTLAFDYPPRSDFFRRELEQFLLLTREENQDPLVLTGSYAGAMGYGQFIASSYRAYAVDFDGNGVRDIWTSPVDAIGSVANYFARHGWRDGEPVLRRVSAAADASLDDLTGRGLRPELDVAALRAAGVEGLDGLKGDADATLWRLDGPDGEELVAGLHNFYVITRYNHSHLYALAVHDLAVAIAAGRRGPGETAVGD